MAQPKQGKTKNGKEMHYSVGAVIEKNGKYLLIDRIVPPLGFAGIAGHIDEDEDPQEALKREVWEESGLKTKKYEPIFEEQLDWNSCSKGVHVHYWHLFKCEASGELRQNTRETKSIGWYSKEQIKDLALEPVWEYWFKKLNII